MDDTTLKKVIGMIAEIEDAGMLGELQENIAAARRGRPRDDLQRYPLCAPMVKTVAGVTARIFNLDPEACLDATIEAILPDTWESLALDEIRRLHARLLFGPEPEKELPPASEPTIWGAAQ